MRKYVFKIELQYDFAIYQGFGRAGLCRGRNPAYSCSGYAGFWPWLLAAGPRRQENAKTRVDRRSTRDFALYRCFGRAGLLWWFLGCWLLWWVGCCSCGHTLEYRMTRWISERTRTRRITDYVCTRLVSKSPVQGVTY